MKKVLDFSAGLPSAASIKSAGYAGVVGYLPKNGSSGVHTITPAYYSQLRSAGLDVNFVYEPVDRLLPWQGHAAGVTEAGWVKKQLAAFPGARNVFIAHDIWEPLSTGLLDAMRGFQRGCHEVLGDIAGAYAFAPALKAFRADGTASKLWLTGSESSEFPGLHLYQQNYGQVTVGGIMCDVSKVLVDDYGQTPGPASSPPPVTIVKDWFDMASLADLKSVVKEVMDDERESYAHRITTWIHSNLTAGIVNHQNTQGTKLDTANKGIDGLQNDVAALKVVLAAVSTAVADVEKKLQVPHV